MGQEEKILDCKQSENEYLHMDFHGALCYAIKYLDDNFGEQATEEYLAQVGKTYFKPLSESLKKYGLTALETHWQSLFQKEGGEIKMYYQDDQLVLEVDQCPAVAHLKKIGMFFTERYCQSTVVVNRTICREAGYRCSCEYQSGEGKCMQKFWRKP